MGLLIDVEEFGGGEYIQAFVNACGTYSNPQVLTYGLMHGLLTSKQANGVISKYCL
ncbi:MAG: hypothetical protein HOJ14_06275, partial [Nitrospina sp.]|nr:hypothetical protein [Nitrospina sp.]